MKQIVYRREIPAITTQTPNGETVVIREAYLQEDSLYFTDSNKETQIAEALKYAYEGKYEIMDVPDERPLHEIKSERIAQSKSDLAAYLESHPVLWTDGKYYSITSEKQQWLTSKLFSATMAQQSGEEYSLTWNDTEEVCTAWDLNELWKLARYIEKRVTDLVTYQQKQEVAMRNAETVDELEAIVVDYDSVVTSDV